MNKYNAETDAAFEKGRHPFLLHSAPNIAVELERLLAEIIVKKYQN